MTRTGDWQITKGFSLAELIEEALPVVRYGQPYKTCLTYLIFLIQPKR